MAEGRKNAKIWQYALVSAAIVALCVLADQLTKYFIFDLHLGGKEHQHADVIGKFVVFDTVLNPGATMGLNLPDVVFFVITLVGIPLFVWLLARSYTRSVWGKIAYPLVIGGTIGNFIDRCYVANEGTFFSGKVRDFIHFDFSALGLTDFFPYSFNIADSCLVIGVIMAIFAIVFFDQDSLLHVLKEEQAAKNGENQKEGVPPQDGQIACDEPQLTGDDEITTESESDDDLNSSVTD